MIRKTILIITAASLWCGGLAAQDVFLQYWRRPEAMLNEQAAIIFGQATEVLDKYPPTADPGVERKLALFSIDALLHDTRLDYGDAFMQYAAASTERVASALAAGKPSGDEVRIFRLYNHGFIIQSRTVTVGIDLIRGSGRPFVDSLMMQSVADKCDILFISHAHGDHADKGVAQMFCRQGKPVVVPTNMWSDLPLTVFRPERPQLRSFKAGGNSLEVTVFPGHQDDIPNNLYAIRLPEGKVIMHTGDQDNSSDVQMLTKVKDEIKVDALLAHCWMQPLQPILDGIQPPVVICGHENEVEHTIDHREPFWLTFRRMAKVGRPCIVMAWGESFILR
jgi:hypothetical protein